MAIANSAPAGSPVLIKPDLGRLNASFGVDRNGRLVYAVQTAASTIQTAEVDFETGRLLAGPTTPVETYLWASDEPDWSRDGRSLVFRLEQPESKMVLAIRDLASGATRHVAPDVGRFSGPTWLPDGGVAVKASDLKGRMAIWRVDPASGATRELVPLDALAGRTFFPSPDGGTVFYLLRQTDRRGVWARNLVTGEERRVAPPSFFAISPDGLSIVCLEPGAAPGTTVLKVAPIAGGEARNVTHFERDHPFVLRWTPDGRRLVYVRSLRERESATGFSIPVSGGVPVELDARIRWGPSLAIHPDGRRVAYEKSGTAYEVWSLEGFQVR
jgi:Tol biopolymer transport system component